MNAYQIQEQCFEFCKKDLPDDLEKTNKEYFEIISAIAFEKGINLDEVTRVIGIVLRDRVLGLHGKPHHELDKHSSPDA